MAYFCLTVLQCSATRKTTAKKYQIDLQILQKIGYLSTESGGKEARTSDGIGHDLTNAETRFLEAAVKAMSHRAAEVDHGDPNAVLGRISLSELQSEPA